MTPSGSHTGLTQDPNPATAAAPAPHAVALRAGYTDPARAQLLPAGVLFDAVTAAMPLGLDALDLLLRGGTAVGPVAADARAQVRRIGFLLPPGTLARARGLAWWCRDHGLRLATHGAVLVLPALIGEPNARLTWLVPPDGAATDPAALLGALRRSLAAGARAPHPFE